MAFQVGDRVKHLDVDDDLVGTVIDVSESKQGQWLTIEWDNALLNADQVEEVL